MDTEKHYIQDACEKLAVWKLTDFAQHDKLAINEDAQHKLREYKKYCSDRGLRTTSSEFKKYLDIYDLHMPQFYEDLKETYPRCKFDFIDVEAQYRNEKKKGDFVVKIEGDQEDERSVSLKAYAGQGGIGKPQLCSGTFNSFPMNFLFQAHGVGTFLTPSGEVFRGCPGPARDEEIKNLGMPELLPFFWALDKIQEKLKARYTRDPEYAWWTDKISEQWRNDCAVWGSEGIDHTIKILNCFTNAQIKKRMIEMIGCFDGREEILFMDKKRMVNSFTSSPIQKLRSVIMDKGTTVKYERHKKSLKFDLVDSSKNVRLGVLIPFTLNRNGAYHLPTNNQEGRYSKKDKMYIEYRQRRPTKSREISTSTNTYVDFAAAGIL